MISTTRASALVVGESLIDIVARQNSAPVELPGGSPLNVAIGLARLGMTAQLHSSIGTDARGAAIRAHAEASGVALSSSTVGAAPTSTATAIIGEDGAARYDFALSSELLPFESTEWFDHVHIGSIGAVLDPGAELVRALIAARSSQSTISYDPNVRPGIVGSSSEMRERVSELIGLSDVVKASDEDLEWLYPGVDPFDAAARIAESGPALVVVTLGSHGSLGIAASGTVRVSGAKVVIADTIGAGDSFMAGLICALGDRRLLGASRRRALGNLSTDDLTEIVSFATACAAITVTRAGANPPRRDDLSL